MRYEVIVIGAGLGGLECACLLSQAGRSVLVLEKEHHVGGCLQSYRRRGQDYDTGFHYVGGLEEGQSLHDAFARLRLLDLPWHRLDEAYDRITLGDRTFFLVQGFDAFAETLAAEFPAERKALQDYAALLARVARDGGGEVQPVDGNDLLETGAWDYLTTRFRDPLLRDVLSGNSLRMELRRESLPLFTFAHCNAGYVESSWRLRGPGSQITDRLAEVIRAHGGDIRCDAVVCELVEKEGRLTAARCRDGETYEADTFISDLHPAVTCRLLRESRVLRKSYRRRMDTQPNTAGVLTVSLRLRPQTLPYFNHNHYVYAQPDVWAACRGEGPVKAVMVSCRVPEDGTDYTRQVDLLTPMAWERCLPWADTTVGRRGEDYEEMKQKVAAECLALAERVIPGLGAMADDCHISTPLTWRDYTGTPDGSAFGLRKDYHEPLTVLLSPRTPVPNLLLTGQSLMLHGVHGVTMTALRTCAEVENRNLDDT